MQLIQQSGQIQENEPLKVQTYSTKKKDPYVQKTLARYPALEFLFQSRFKKGRLEAESKKRNETLYRSCLNLTLCRLQSRPQYMSMGNPMPESTLSFVKALGFGL
jgi:hypothetical protein